MSIYNRIYISLCESRKQYKNQYKPKSGLHKHHITPTHSGGLDSEENYTYLTIREHKIAHYLLWKINKNVNDLRSMYMLGANLSPEKRSIIGKWCYDNKIGVHGMGEEYMLNNLDKGRKTQKLQYEEHGIKNWYYWSTEEGQKERSSIGGKIGGRLTCENKRGPWDPANAEKQKQAQINGGKSAKGNRWLWDPSTNKSRFVKPTSDVWNELIANGYIPGHSPKAKT